MRIKDGRRFAVGAMLLVFLLPFLLFGCASGRTAEETGKTAEYAKAEENGETRNVAHFSEFEVTVPSGWSGKGNAEKLFSEESGSGETIALFALAGSAEQPEECLQKNLALFFSTEFYRDRVRFLYAERKAVPHGERVSGTLYNGRTGEKLLFCGYYIQQPACHFVYFSRTEALRSILGRYADESFEGYAPAE